MTNTKRIWMVSDTHLGCRSNAVEWMEIIEDYFFNFFIPLIKREYREGDILYHLGDVFDNRQSVNLMAQHLAIRVFEALADIFPETHVIVGNHDIYRKNSNDISSVDCLKYIPKIHIHKDPVVHTYPSGKSSLLMPWRRDPDHEKETLEEYGTHNYLFCHSEVKGLRLGPNPKNVQDFGNDAEIYQGFDKVFSGHIHIRQQTKNVFMVGNPYHMTRSDRSNTKGVYLLNLETGTLDFFENTISPEFQTYDISSIYDLTLEEFKDKVKSNFVDLYIPSTIVSRYNISKLMNLLEGAARKMEPSIYDEDQAFVDFDDSDEEIEISYKNMNILNLAKRYLDQTGYDKEVIEKMYSKIESLYSSLNEKA